MDGSFQRAEAQTILPVYNNLDPQPDTVLSVLFMTRKFPKEIMTQGLSVG